MKLLFCVIRVRKGNLGIFKTVVFNIKLGRIFIKCDFYKKIIKYYYKYLNRCHSGTFYIPKLKYPNKYTIYLYM